MKKVARAALTSVVMLTATSLMFAQDGKPKYKEGEKKEHFEKIEAAKKEYFTKELKLTEKESEKFWAVYDEFKKAEKANRKKQREIGKELHSNLDSIPEKEVKTKMESILTLESESVQIKKNYLTKSAEVIGYKRAVKSLHLEREFKRELMDRVKEKRKGKGSDSKRGEFRRAPVEE